MNCDFSDDFLCGYINEYGSDRFHWRKRKADRKNVRGEPLTDGVKSEVGEYLWKSLSQCKYTCNNT